MPRAADNPTRSPVKLPGPVRHRNAVEGGERDAGRLDDACDQRHQGLGMAALHGLRFLRNQPAGLRVEHAGGAGIERGVEARISIRGFISAASGEASLPPHKHASR